MKYGIDGSELETMGWLVGYKFQTIIQQQKQYSKLFKDSTVRGGKNIMSNQLTIINNTIDHNWPN